MRRYRLLPLFTLLFSSLLFSQQQTEKPDDKKPQTPLTYGVDVELAQVAVRITDKDGNWVSGLQKSELELIEDGVTQEILYIDEIGGETAVVETSTLTGKKAEQVKEREPAENSLIILIDGTGSGKIAIEKQKKYLKEFLESNPVTVQISVVQTDPTGNYEIVQAFTSDKQLLGKAIERIGGSFAGSSDKEFKYSKLADTSPVEQCAALRNIGISPLQCVEEALRSILRLGAAYAQEEEARSTRSLNSLTKIFEFAYHMPGKKNILLVSEGIDPAGISYINFAANVIDYFITRYGLPDNMRRRFTREIRVDANKVGNRIEEIRNLVKAANASDLTVYWVDPDYSKSPSGISADMGPIATFSSPLVNAPDTTFAMSGLAEDTGGARVTSTDFGKFYKKVLASVPRYYLVSYRPNRELNDGKFHRLEVRVKRKGCQVAYKKDFKDLKSAERVTAELAAGHDFPSSGDMSGMLAEVKYFRKSDDEFHLMIGAGMPYDKIQPKIEGANVTDDIHFSFLVRDKEGNVFLNTHPIIELRSSYQEFETLKSKDAVLEYMQSCNLKPGEYEVSVVALDSAQSSKAVSSISISLPATNGACLSLSPILLASRTSKSQNPAPTPTTTESGEIIYGENSFRFEMSRIFPENGSLSGFYQIYSTRPASVFVSFKLYKGEIFINGTSEREIKPGTEQKLISNFFSVPYNNLPPGDYQLELIVRDTSGQCQSSGRVSFEITSDQMIASAGE